MRSRLAVAVFALTSVLFEVGCGGGGETTGACVRGTGATATCGDDFTAGQCVLVAGDKFYEGTTCKALGFR